MSFIFKLRRFILVAAACSGLGAHAQPADLPIAPATTDIYPLGVTVMKLPDGAVYASKAGLTLYGMDMRMVLRAGPDPAQYCAGRCAEEWQPLRAPPQSRPNIRFPTENLRSTGLPTGFAAPQTAPDWTIIEGADGPQWVYKGWHLVFTRKGDKRMSTAFEGIENKTWNTLKFVPPVPKIVTPANVRPAFVDGAYALADDKGHLLFTGQCSATCAGWQPFAGGLASAAIGEWHVGIEGDVPQWYYRNIPVFVGPDGSDIPKGGKALRP